jgi:4-carboxymuconolactone decarboxylase
VQSANPALRKGRDEGDESMSVPTQKAPKAGSGKPGTKKVDTTTMRGLTALALGHTEGLEQAVELREVLRQESGLDPRVFSLVKIAALVAVDAPPASYFLQVQAALAEGVPPREILGVLTAIAPQVGMPRIVAAAPEVMVALDLELPAGTDSGRD